MLDTFRTRIANWIAPDRPVPNVIEDWEREVLGDALQHDLTMAREEVAMHRGEAIQVRSANVKHLTTIEDQRSKLVVAGLKITLMKKALANTRGYVLDALDEARDALNALPLKSKKRPASAIIVAMIEQDAEALHAAMADTKTPVAA